MEPIVGDEGVWNETLARALIVARGEVAALGRIANSPIEARFLAAFWNHATLLSKTAYDENGIDVAFAPRVMAPGQIDVRAQAPVGTYRADFRIDVTLHRRRFGFVVELDGHDFHEKTREQVAHDKKRDRFFIAQGVPAFRFSGSEIWRDAPACAAEVFAHIDRQAMPGPEDEEAARAKRRARREADRREAEAKR